MVYACTGCSVDIYWRVCVCAQQAAASRSVCVLKKI